MKRKLVPIDSKGRAGGAIPPPEPPQGPLDRLISSLTRDFRKAVERDVDRALVALERREGVPLDQLEAHYASHRQLETVRTVIRRGGLEGAIAAFRTRPVVRGLLAQMPGRG